MNARYLGVTEETYQKIFDRNAEYVKGILEKKGIPFSIWTSEYKGAAFRLFTGMTIRKQLSSQPFLDSFNSNEGPYIEQIAKDIFPEMIYEDTDRRMYNYAQVTFCNLYERTKKSCKAYKLHKGKSCYEEAFRELGTANAAMYLCTYTNPGCNKRDIYSINAIAVGIDYKDSIFSDTCDIVKIMSKLENDYFEKVIPRPTYIIDEDNLILVFVFQRPVYLHGKNREIRFIDWMSKVFADRLKDLGGFPVSVYEPVLLHGSAVAKGRDKHVRCEARWIKYSDYKTDASNLRAYLDTMDEVRMKMPWYKTEAERSMMPKRKNNNWDPSFKNHNEKILKDLVVIRDYYNGNGIYWHNNQLLFIYCVYSLKVSGNRDSAMCLVNSFIEGFMGDYSRKAVHAMECACMKTYNYKNETILKKLGITGDENLPVYMCISKINRKSYLKIWKGSKSMAAKEQKKKDKDRKSSIIIKLRNEGKKNMEILKTLAAKGFSMSIKTLERHIHKLMEDGKVETRKLSPT